MSWWAILLLVLLLLWILFNWLSPLALLAFSQRMSIGRIPGEILARANKHNVSYYIANLSSRGYAFTTCLGWRYAVVLDRAFLQQAQPAQIRFVLAHELGHCALGHVKLKIICVTTGLILLPFVRDRLKELEEAADEFASNLSGLPRDILRNPAKAEVFSLLEHAKKNGPPY